MDLLIKGGTVVTATSSFKADVAVKNGKITAVGANLKPEKKTEEGNQEESTAGSACALFWFFWNLPAIY